MAYGVEVLDLNGRTVFNSTHPCELTIWSGEIVTATQTNNTYGGGGGGVSAHIPLPDYCFGSDNGVLGTAVTRNTLSSAPTVTTNLGAGYSVVNYTGTLADDEVLMPYISPTEAAARINGRMLFNYIGVAYFESSTHYGVVAGPGWTFDWSQAYTVWKMKAGTDMSALHGTVTGTSVATFTTADRSPTIWIRPKSSSFSGRFSILAGNYVTRYGNTSFATTPHYAVPRPTVLGENSLYNTGFVLFTDQTGGHTFEVKITAPASDWGAIASTHTLKYAVDIVNGSNPIPTHGIESYTDSGFQHHSASTVGQWTTYSSLSRPAKVYEAKGLAPPSYTPNWNLSTSVSTQTMINVASGSAANDNKYYCRMTGTSKVANKAYYDGTYSTIATYTHMYQWDANYDIEAQWRRIYYVGVGVNHYPTSVYGRHTYGNKQLFAIADFGEPM